MVRLDQGVKCKLVSARVLTCMLFLLFSHINSCQQSRVRGHTKVLEPYEDPKNRVKSKFAREILRFPA